MNKELTSNTTIDDVLDCPTCGSDDTYTYNTDEIEFSSDGTGHYFVDCQCKKCNNSFRKYIHFKYQITSCN